MIKRELHSITIYVGSDPSLDQIRAEITIADDDEGTSAGKSKELNMGDQLGTEVQAVIARVLNKLTTASKTVSRPTA